MNIFKKQLLPIFLTFATFIFLTALLFLIISFLNGFTSKDIILKLLPADILVGLTIYLKTSFDFAIFIASIMNKNNGWVKRIAIEMGTSVGNALGTFLILIVWVFFKEVPALLAAMILLASLVLFQMAQEGLEEFIENKNSKNQLILKVNFLLSKINSISRPFLSKIIPSGKTRDVKPMAFLGLLLFSITIPFILGLDDFAGYIPVFTIVNIFGFCTGVLLGHMILNTLLFVSPDKTIKISKNPAILIIGSFAFIFIAVYGILEVLRILV